MDLKVVRVDSFGREWLRPRQLEEKYGLGGLPSGGYFRRCGRAQNTDGQSSTYPPSYALSVIKIFWNFCTVKVDFT